MGEKIDAGDVLVVGGGLAGLFMALKAAPLRVTVITPAAIGAAGSAASAWAQGGIAAAVDAEDSPADHSADTRAAGGGISDPAMSDILAREVPARIEDLTALGVSFDRRPDGGFALAREAAHRRRRIVRVSGDLSGRAIMRALVRAVAAAEHIRVVEGVRALALERGGQTGAVCGAWAADGGGVHFFGARAVMMAAGGAGRLYAMTTNPPQANGAALAMAARAGAQIADPEFVQFHPTAIDAGLDPAPLATEALRGEGAVLIDEHGRRFMAQAHEDGELAPRDIVARSVARIRREGGRVFLDARAKPGADFRQRFPAVWAACRKAGIDPARRPIPVAPAAHYHMGGIAVDGRGRASLEGLWACGEAACTGAHGANRLAGNSLGETLVLGARIARDLKSVAAGRGPRPETGQAPPCRGEDGAEKIARLRQIMMGCAGVMRSGAGLRAGAGQLAAMARARGGVLDGMIVAATLIIAGALAREESRGGHFRSDFPHPDPLFARRTRLTLAQAEAIVSSARPAAQQAAR